MEEYPELEKMHENAEYPEPSWGAAISRCREIDGNLWVDNEEYASLVNFCPFCGLGTQKTKREEELEEKVEELEYEILEMGERDTL